MDVNVFAIHSLVILCVRAPEKGKPLEKYKIKFFFSFQRYSAIAFFFSLFLVLLLLLLKWGNKHCEQAGKRVGREGEREIKVNFKEGALKESIVDAHPPRSPPSSCRLLLREQQIILSLAFIYYRQAQTQISAPLFLHRYIYCHRARERRKNRFS
jgi:hypothetical protein